MGYGSTLLDSHVRLGPSASEAPHNHNMLSDVLKAMNVLQNAMKEPWAKQLLGGLISAPSMPAPVPVDPKTEMPEPPKRDSVGGSYNKPAVEIPQEGIGKPPPKDKGTGEKAKDGPPSLPTPPVEPLPKPDAPDPQIVNSSTHRAAHARLSRRMSSCDTCDCPNMQRLWSGTRKDFTRIVKLKFWKLVEISFFRQPLFKV